MNIPFPRFNTRGVVSDEPVINSLLDLDFYKLSMGQFIYTRYPDVDVTFQFMNRGDEKLGEIIPEKTLRRELDHVMGLSLSQSEIGHLRGMDNYGRLFFSEEYLGFLRDLRMPEYKLRYLPNGQIDLRFPGKWPKTTNWELYSMRIVNELYFREILRRMTPFERDCVYATGVLNLMELVKFLNDNPHIFVANFGCRRCFSFEWALYIDWVLKHMVKNPKQIRGTSSVLIAMLLSIPAIGTNAHELQMVLAALAAMLSDEELAASPHKLLDEWYEFYGAALAVALPDTFGSRYMMRTMSQKNLERYRGIRLDSGDPHKEGDEWIGTWMRKGIDPKSKFLLPSDDLKPARVLSLDRHFEGRTMKTFGWGTFITNNLGLKPLKVVTKVLDANGERAVKLSNDLGKSTGTDDRVVRYKRVFGYDQD